MRTLALTIAISLGTAAAAFAAPPVKTVESEKGPVLAAENGMTLYTFKTTRRASSACYDACATNWPPFMVEGDATAEGAFSVVERKDGSKQWAKDGMPLYFWGEGQENG